MKTNLASDQEEHYQLIEKVNAPANNMKLLLAEKDKSREIASETIDRPETSLTGFPTGGCVHMLKTSVPDTDMALHCITLKYDKDRVNNDKVHINTEGELVNRKSDTRPAGVGRLKRYEGTCSTVPLPQDGCPQYWEVENWVTVDEPLSDNRLILEIGVSREEERDVHHCIAGRPHSYSMNVSQCTVHGGICRWIWKEGECVLCLPDTLPNTAGASHTLHYGVVYDDVRKKIVFVDVKEEKVMSTVENVDSSEPLWPMFGVYNPSLLIVSMRLVLGNDINRTEEKKVTIVKALK
ncbi:uncharacterized protein [Haliotis asinina]|uniref:uncharacterized protein n=1 Tax=Haliotis asinina TaxID=109174 RepID=UPI0035323BB3